MGLTRTRVRVEGIVQGVGFRPFVHALAGRLGLAGLVGNIWRGVGVEGPAETVSSAMAARPAAGRTAGDGPAGAHGRGSRSPPARPAGAPGAGLARHRHLRRLPASWATRGPAPPPPVRQLHQLRAASPSSATPLRPPATTMAAFAMCPTAPASTTTRRPAVPRPAGVLPGLRAALRCWTGTGGRPRGPAAGRWPAPDGAVVAVRASAATTWPPTRPASRPPPRARKRREDKPFA
jgi:hydrogenase maturation protein HypF